MDEGKETFLYYENSFFFFLYKISLEKESHKGKRIANKNERRKHRRQTSSDSSDNSLATRRYSHQDRAEYMSKSVR